MKKCPECKTDMILTDMPQAIFTIPFTKGRFCIWDWNKKEYWCEDCAISQENSKQKELHDNIADDIGRKAYQEGYEDGINER